MSAVENPKHSGEISREELHRWLKLDSWNLREAALLSCGQRPKQTSLAHTTGRVTKRFAGSPGTVVRNADATELDEMTDLIRRARNVGVLDDPVKPAAFIHWLKLKRPEAKLFRISGEDFGLHGTTQAILPGQPLTPHQKSAETNKLGKSHKILLALAVKYTSYDQNDNKSSIDKIKKALDECGLDVGRDTVIKHLGAAYASNSDALRSSTIYDRKKS